MYYLIKTILPTQNNLFLELLNTDIRSINFDISDVKTTPDNNNLTSALVVEASVKGKN